MRRTLALCTVLGAASLAVAAPADQSAAATRATPVPVLTYHAIGSPPKGAAYPDLYVSRAAFAAEMRALARRGFHAVTLSRVYEHWLHGARLPRHPIVITFDDGYRSVYEVAFPVLRRQKWPGVLNLEVRFMNKPWGLARTRIIRLLHAHWELASHTINHRDLTSLGPTALEHEVLDSRFLLQRTFVVPVRFFCYPAGRYDATVIEAVKAAGYVGATSTRSGLARPSEMYTLARIRVARGDSAAKLLSTLASLGA